jgi:hypothetical protein
MTAVSRTSRSGFALSFIALPWVAPRRAVGKRGLNSVTTPLSSVPTAHAMGNAFG